MRFRAPVLSPDICSVLGRAVTGLDYVPMHCGHPRGRMSAALSGVRAVPSREAEELLLILSVAVRSAALDWADPSPVEIPETFFGVFDSDEWSSEPLLYHVTPPVGSPLAEFDTAIRSALKAVGANVHVLTSAVPSGAGPASASLGTRSRQVEAPALKQALETVDGSDALQRDQLRALAAFCGALDGRGGPSVEEMVEEKAALLYEDG